MLADRMTPAVMIAKIPPAVSTIELIPHLSVAALLVIVCMGITTAIKVIRQDIATWLLAWSLWSWWHMVCLCCLFIPLGGLVGWLQSLTCW